MKCDLCGTENPSNAVFCKHCGHRLDNMSVCQHCGKLTPVDGQFCINCGANRDSRVIDIPAKSVEETSKETKQTRFFASKTENDDLDEVKKHEKHGSKFNAGTIGKALRITSLAAGGLSFLFSLIFVFLIGVTSQISSGGASIGQNIIDYNLYSYFGDLLTQYDSINDALVRYGVFGSYFGLASVVFILLGVIATIVYSGVSFYKNYKKGTISFTKYAAIFFFVYLASSMLFFFNIFSSSDITGISVSLVLNQATIAGLVLSGLFLLVALVVDSFINGVQGNLKDYLIKTISSSLITIFGIVVFAFIGQGLFTLVADNPTTSIVISMSASVGVLGVASLLFNLAQSVYTSQDSTRWSQVNEMYTGTIVFLSLLLVLIIIFAIFFVLLAKEFFGENGHVNTKKTLSYGLTAGIAAIIFGAIAIYFNYWFVDFMNTIAGTTQDTTSVSLTNPIVILVFGVFILVGVIVLKVLSPKDETFDEKPELEEVKE